jgi:hypothetical protein
VRYDYFKHYFTTQDIAQLFPHEEFEQLYFAEVSSVYTKADKAFDELWVREWFHQNGKLGAEAIEQKAQKHLADNSHTQIITLVRKRWQY